jgi:RNA polymerase sigma-70 factor, ECF subfamily
LEAAERLRSFESVVLPHLRAAHTLARWMLKIEADAEDVVQEAMLRAFRGFDGFRGGDARVWLLTVVRNAVWSHLSQKRVLKESVEFDEEAHGGQGGGRGETPEVLLLRSLQHRQLEEAVESLDPEFREVLVLREVEGLSYKEIAQVSRVPIGTVMSRLSRARQKVQETMESREKAGGVR